MTGIESLEEIKKGIANCCYDGKKLGYYKPHFDTIEKELKALEIIKENDISFFWLKYCNNVKEYNQKVEDFLSITEEEFELIKEVLEWD